MNSIKLDLKTLITVGGIVAVLGGFYFTTELRLASLETKIQEITAETEFLHSADKNSSKQIKRLLKRINQLEK